MEPASDGVLRNKLNEMAVARRTEDSQRIANQEKEDERFEQFRKSKLDNFDAAATKLEKKRQAEFAASMTALTAKQHQEIVELENVHKSQLQREQQKWEQTKLESYRTIENERARLEMGQKVLKERRQRGLEAPVQGQQNIDGKKDIKDHSIGNKLLTDSAADTDPGNLAQQQIPARLLLATQPNQVLNVPYNNHPFAPLESPPKRQRLQGVEKIPKPEENDLDGSPTQKLYNIPVYPSSRVSTPQHSPAKPLYRSPASTGPRPRIPQYSHSQARYGSPVYPLSGTPIPQQWQTTALGQLSSMNPSYTGAGLPIPQQSHATASGQLSSMNPSYTETGLPIPQQWLATAPGQLSSMNTSYGFPIPQLLQPGPNHNNPICTKPGTPEQQVEFYSIKAFRCGPTTWRAAVPHPSQKVKAIMTLRSDNNRKVVELYYNNICKSKDYPETILSSSVDQQLFYNHGTARLELSRTNRSTVKIEFENSTELLNFLELFKFYHGGNLPVKHLKGDWATHSDWLNL